MDSVWRSRSSGVGRSVEVWGAGWSELVGFVQLWLGFGGIGEGLGSRGVDEFVVGVVEGFGLCVGERAGFGGGAEFAEDQAVLAQGGGDGAVVDLVEAGDLSGCGAFDERCDSAAVGDEGEGFEGFGGVLLEESVDAAAEEGDVFEEEVVGGLFGDVGPVGFEELEVGVDGGVGDAESLGDLAE